MKWNRSVILAIGIIVHICFCHNLKAQDNTPPVITVPALSQTVPCAATNILGTLTAWYDDNGGAEATDNSGTVSFITIPPFDNVIQIFEASSDTLCGNTRGVNVTFIAVDPSGNQSQPTTARFSTFDNVKPVVTVSPQSIEVACFAGIQDSLVSWIKAHGMAVATDACSEPIVWTEFISNLPPSGTHSIDNGPYPNIPPNRCDVSANVTFFVVDDCGNRTATTATFRVRDLSGPVLDTLPPDVTVSCDNIPERPLVRAFDLCYGELMVVFEETNNQGGDSTKCEYYSYDITRTWTSTDICGNETKHTQVISVQDQHPPGILFENPLVVNCTDILAHNVLNNIDSLWDDCSDSLTILFVDNGTIGGCQFTINRVYSIKDICGNETQDVQTLLVRDTLPPTVTTPAHDSILLCSSATDYQAAFETWLANRAGTTSTDDCSNTVIFPAIPGSYDPDDPSTFPGIAPDSLDKTACPSNLPGFIRYQQVDFLHIDLCQNLTVSSAIFGIRDLNRPNLSTCPPNRTVSLPAGSCEMSLQEVFPHVTDDCSLASDTYDVSNTFPVTSSVPGDPQVLVDTVYIEIGPINSQLFTPINDPVFSFFYRDLDMDDLTEFFNIYNEDGVVIAPSPQTNVQCGDVLQILDSISLADFMRWQEDGYVSFTLIPNPANPGVQGINDVCPGASIVASMSLEVESESQLNAYIRVNNQELNPAISGELTAFDVQLGINEINYLAIDCAGNISDCFQQITVVDQIPPVLSCGGSVDYYAGEEDCTGDLLLPLDITITENCRFPEVYNQTYPANFEGQAITFSYDPFTQVHTATNRQFVFDNVQPIKYGQFARLIFEIMGDIDEAGEFYTLLGEDGTQLAKTTVLPGSNCSASTIEFTLPRSVFNLWANDGQIKITATAPGAFTEGGGINPCVPLDPGDTMDGISSFKGTLIYYDAQLVYEVNGDGNRIDVPSNQDTLALSLLPGSNTIVFEVSDFGGNTASCSREVIVTDTIAPKAICKNDTVQIHPSGLDFTLLEAENINNQSTDNCTITSFELINDTLDCSMAGSLHTAFLVAVDAEGNRDTCAATIDVRSYVLQPGFSSGICLGDTLKLFANLPDSPFPTSYTFEWTKDGSLISNDENPCLPDASSALNGTYSLTVTGFGGCVSQGSVEVVFNPLTKPLLESAATTYCENETFTLQCSSFGGSVTYEWFEGVFPDGNKVGDTSSPELSLNRPLGTRSYYVIASNANCMSEPSDPLTITAIAKPIAQVESSFITVCEGSLFSLNSLNTENGIQYYWSGPNGFTSDQKQPPSVPSSSLTQGRYNLVVAFDGCYSDTTAVNVTLLPRPEKPEITGELIYCKGSTFSLAVNNITNGTFYNWYLNDVLFRTTQDNNLDIPNAQTDLTGDWTVIVVRDGCSSFESDPLGITVDDLINVGASNSGPVCFGDSVELTATFVPNATYSWSGPGFSATGQTVIAPAVAGDYTVTITTSTNCSNVASTEVLVNTPPTITALSSTNSGCIGPGTTITFTPTIFPAGSYTYQWTGPNGYSSNVLNPTLSNLSPDNKGDYTLRVFFNGCSSEPVTLNIDFEIKPNLPSISGENTYCEGETIQLFSSESAVTYHWSTPTGKVSTAEPNLILPNANRPLSGAYRLVLENNGCFSDSSTFFNLIVFDTPPAPTVSGPIDVCHGDQVVISSNINDGESYEWVLPDNSTLDINAIVIPFATAGNEGNYQLSYVKNGCRSNLSNPFILEVKDSIRTPAFVDASISLCSEFITAEQICLDAATLDNGTQYDLVNTATGQVIAQTNGLCFTLTDPADLVSGSNFLEVVGHRDGCSSRASQPILVFFQSPPNLEAQAVDDLLIACKSQNFVTIDAVNGPPEVEIFWRNLTPGITIGDANAKSTVVSNLLPGENLIELNYSKDGCRNYSSDTLSIFLEPDPVVRDDNYTAAFNEAIIIDPLINDDLPENYTVVADDSGSKGEVSIDGTTFTYTPNTGTAGAVSFTYTVCVAGCPDQCETAVVNIFVGRNIDCEVPSIFTPNGDGVNDQLIVPCLNARDFPNARMTVFNEWGDEVFTAKPYLNDWDGTYGGEDLPAGTYFLIFDPGNGGNVLRNFLILQR